jgi:hypothetical protein
MPRTESHVLNKIPKKKIPKKRILKGQVNWKKVREDAPTLTKPFSIMSKDFPQIPLADMKAWANRSTETRQKEAKDSGRVGRPWNAFILYRSTYAKLAQHFSQHIQNQVISLLMGESWRIETAEVQNLFHTYAKIELVNHQQAHPDYKFSCRPKVQTRKYTRKLTAIGSPTDAVLPSNSPDFNTSTVEPLLVSNTGYSVFEEQMGNIPQLGFSFDPAPCSYEHIMVPITADQGYYFNANLEDQQIMPSNPPLDSYDFDLSPQTIDPALLFWDHPSSIYSPIDWSGEDFPATQLVRVETDDWM